MSSTYQSASPSVDPHSSRDFNDELGLNHHILTNPFDFSLLSSPFTHSLAISNSASPLYTSGESLSEYSNFQSDIDDVDPFFGVNFDDGVQRINSLPITITPRNVAYPSATLKQASPTQASNQPSSATWAISTYPLSPSHTIIPNTPSLKRAVSETTRTTISQHELNTGLHSSRLHPGPEMGPTPDNSGSSHTSAEGLEPSSMPRSGHSPSLMVSHWGDRQQNSQPPPFLQSNQGYNATNAENCGGDVLSQTQYQHPHMATERDDDGLWRASEVNGQSGLDPDSRKVIKDEVPTLKEQEEYRRIQDKNSEVEEWRSQAGEKSDAENEQPVQSYFPLNSNIWYPRGDPGTGTPRDEEYNNLAPLDDSASVHENRLAEGQTYFDLNSIYISDVDKQELINHARHWQDGPSVPHIMTSSFQPQTSNEAMKRFNRAADSFSIASRAATWGTRRRSEPSLADFEGISDGSFLKKLSISSKSREERPRQNSLLDQGLNRLASFTRKRSDSKLKRVRSTQNLPEETQAPPNARHYSQDSLAPPTGSPSSAKKQTVSINTAFAAMTGPLAAVGTTHTRRTSVGNMITSPKSPVHLGFKSVIRRARSRSELTSQEKNRQTGLVSLWRGQGGPPVLATPPTPAEVKAKRPEPEVNDHEDDNDDEDEPSDENDPKMESGHQADLIVANYEGFKSHVRRLNPDMDPRHNWLVSRIAHQQEIRYKNLLDLRVKHLQAINSRKCSAGPHCLALGGSITLTDVKGNPRDQDRTPASLRLVTDFSDDSDPVEGTITAQTFPAGVPMPPTNNLPAEFECQLCFKAKKFQKPSDWTKHVHEDVQPFTCTYDKCKEPKSFKRKADWVRHENERHRHLEWWICQVGDCSHPCYRKDNFLQHLVREHKVPEPKQKTRAAIKKACTTEPAWEWLEKCYHQTHNRPQDEPCKFCGRSFPTWKKLTVHLAKHMEHISLPILRLVEAKAVDANTIISPVEQILTPVTPMSRATVEFHSPLDMDSVSPNITTGSQFVSTDFEQPEYFQTDGSSIGYGLQTPLPQETRYSNNSDNMYSTAFDVESMGQTRGFDTLNPNTMVHVDQTRAFGPLDSDFSQPRAEPIRGFGSMDYAFSHVMPGQNCNMHQNSGCSIPQTFSTAAAPISGFPNSNMQGAAEAGFGSIDPVNGRGVQNFQQVPRSHAYGSAPTYRHSPRDIPRNAQSSYGHQ
ncbi:hypothetical protein LZ554_002558 [Drepanopeziza brunnea f. sp. 'monogermtubi']|nr:hypothetical protein LZ554_002558 [Drepanopeziza brunnea f. sp. 'monogermtubi']